MGHRLRAKLCPSESTEDSRAAKDSPLRSGVMKMPTHPDRRSAILGSIGAASALTPTGDSVGAALPLQVENVTRLYPVEVSRIDVPGSAAEVSASVKAWKGQVAVGGTEQLAVQHIAVGGLLAVQIRRQPAGGALFAVVFDVAPHLVLLLADPVVPVAAGTQGLRARYGTRGLRDLDDLGFFLLDRFLRQGGLFRLAATGGQQQAQAEREKFVAVMHTLPGLLD